MKKTIYLFLAFSLFLTSCGSEEKKEENKKDKKESKEEKTSEDCTYTIDAEKINVSFIAYKFESKKGVNGQFQEIEINGANAVADPMLASEGISFSIPISSLYTGDPARDKKIKESFFGTMAATEMITGSVKSLEGEKAVLEIKMNEITFEIEATQKLEMESIILEAEINTDNWNGQDAIAALHKVCEANHADPEGGKSILWPNVTLKIQGQLKKECK
jgi:polyisoprenoid-binding protein YceI